MKLKPAVLAVSLLAFAANAANAGSWSFGLNGGAGMPTGDFGNLAGTGWNIGVTTTSMVNEKWGFGADLGYHSWGASDDIEALLGPGESYSLRGIQATGHAVLRVPTNGNITPYFKVGTGLYNLAEKLEDASGDLSNSESRFGFNFGAGMLFSTQGNMTWGFNGTYHIAPADNNGIDADVFTVGLNMNWGMGN